MKLLLTTLNSKYVHSCLSIRYLRGYAEDLIDTELKEYTINQNIDYIVSEIYKLKPSIVAFSTYIWNLNETLEIIEILKIIMPDLDILLGGPEVTFDGDKLMKQNQNIDFIIYGEGEYTFKEFLDQYLSKKDYSDIKGLIYRDFNVVIKNKERPLIRDLNTIPSPYDYRVTKELKNRIVYYESSRGCPFNCKFCLSSTIKGVRYFDLERVKNELTLLMDAKVRQVKFVDRTFNANKQYAMEIMNHIMKRNPEGINFHFEVTAHLLDEEMLSFLSNVKEGLFQFEVGVQSTNPKTIEAVGRTTDFKKLKEVTKKIKSFKRIHQHLDLIAGLPYEDYNSFAKSFDDVYDIRPEKIQLGFLKLLKGSQLRALEDYYGFKYVNKPPYEILFNDFIGYADIRKLKIIEEMVEIYYNGEIYKHSMEYLLANKYKSPFNLYESLAKFWESKNYHKISHSRRKLYDILVEFCEAENLESMDIYKELLKLDFIENNKGQQLPSKLKSLSIGIHRSQIHQLLKDENLLSNELKDYRYHQTRDLIKICRLELFEIDVLKIRDNQYVINQKENINKHTYILTIYIEGVLKTSKSIDVTSIVKGLIK